MSIPSNAQFGIPFGEKLAPVGSAQTLVDGLTTCRYVLVKPLSTNLGDLLITSKTGAGPGAGLRLKPADPPIELDLKYDNQSLLFLATSNGTTCCYIGKGSQVE